jgi:hypothetical protein
MRTQYIPFETDHPEHETAADTIEGAWVVAPWAAEIVEVEGGFMAFESVADYDTWRRQT